MAANKYDIVMTENNEPAMKIIMPLWDPGCSTSDFEDDMDESLEELPAKDQHNCTTDTELTDADDCWE